MTSRPLGVTCPEFLAVLRVFHDEALGLLSVEHDGSITWDTLQKIKDLVFGVDAVAIEIYPPHARVVNNVAMRHLWLLGPDDWWPDLGREGEPETISLRDRYLATQITGGGDHGRL